MDSLLLQYVTFKVFIFLCFLFALAWFILKRSKVNPNNQTDKSKFSITNRVGFNQNVGLALVQYAGKEHLVSYSAQNVELLFSKENQHEDSNE